MKERISVVITSKDRFDKLLVAIESIKNQTYGFENLEVIVMDDKSDDQRYREENAIPGVSIINLPTTSKDLFGFINISNAKNQGISMATSKYIAFVDDDDFWFPEKIEKQMKALQENTSCRMCCTEALMGKGAYNPEEKYPVYHREFYGRFCSEFFRQYYGSWEGRLPDIFTLDLLSKHNFIIGSSMLAEKELFEEAGLFSNSYEFYRREDWEFWCRCLKLTNCIHLNEPLLWYDGREKVDKIQAQDKNEEIVINTGT